MRVWPWFGRFLRKVSAITRCPLYSMSAIDRFDCTWFYYLLNYLLNSYLIFSFCFSQGITNMPQVNFLSVSANNLQTLLSMHLLAYTSCTAKQGYFLNVRPVDQFQVNWHTRALSKWFYRRPGVSVWARGIRLALNKFWNFL